MIRASILFFLLIISNFSFAQDEAVLAKDVTFSIGAGKNRFFEEREFGIASPLEVPVGFNIGLSKFVEIGFDFTPIFFNDRSAYDFSGLDSTKNHFAGHLLNYNANLHYSLVNNFRMSGYVVVNGGYSNLHKKQWIIGDLNELKGEGYNYSFGGGLRYQLGNEYDDVFPWYFDFSIVYTKFNLKMTSYTIDGITQPSINNSWDPLEFGSIDVNLRIGYRLRFK